MFESLSADACALAGGLWVTFCQENGPHRALHGREGGGND